MRLVSVQTVQAISAAQAGPLAAPVSCPAGSPAALGGKLRPGSVKAANAVPGKAVVVTNAGTLFALHAGLVPGRVPARLVALSPAVPPRPGRSARQLQPPGPTTVHAAPCHPRRTSGSLRPGTGEARPQAIWGSLTLLGPLRVKAFCRALTPVRIVAGATWTGSPRPSTGPSDGRPGPGPSGFGTGEPGPGAH